VTVEKLGEYTIRKRSQIARQIFKSALKQKLISGDNPSGTLATVVKPDATRFHFVNQSDADATLDDDWQRGSGIDVQAEAPQKAVQESAEDGGNGPEKPAVVGDDASQFPEDSRVVPPAPVEPENSSGRYWTRRNRKIRGKNVVFHLRPT
jgi:hypothetical protein